MLKAKKDVEMSTKPGRRWKEVGGLVWSGLGFGLHQPLTNEASLGSPPPSVSSFRRAGADWLPRVFPLAELVAVTVAEQLRRGGYSVNLRPVNSFVIGRKNRSLDCYGLVFV